MDTPFTNEWESILAEIGINPFLIEFYPDIEMYRNDLSRRDIAFCFMVSRGIDRAEAFRIAYSSGLAAHNIRPAANRKLREPFVFAEMQRLINGEIPSPVHDPGWLQRTVMQKLLEMMDSADTDASKIKAGEALLRHVGVTVAEISKLMAAKHPPVESPSDIERIIREHQPETQKLPAPEDLTLN